MQVLSYKKLLCPCWNRTWTRSCTLRIRLFATRMWSLIVFETLSRNTESSARYQHHHINLYIQLTIVVTSSQCFLHRHLIGTWGWTRTTFDSHTNHTISSHQKCLMCNPTFPNSQQPPQSRPSLHQPVRALPQPTSNSQQIQGVPHLQQSLWMLLNLQPPNRFKQPPSSLRWGLWLLQHFHFQ